MEYYYRSKQLDFNVTIRHSEPHVTIWMHEFVRIRLRQNNHL